MCPTEVIPDPNPPPKDITIEGATFQLERRYAQGDQCDLYVCTYTPKAEPPKPMVLEDAWDALMAPEIEDASEAITGSLFKIARNPLDTDLVQNEATVLGTLYPREQADERYFRYLPKLLLSTTYGSGRTRAVNLLTRYDGYYPISDVMGVYPQGLDFRDAVWSYKRLLVGLGYVHQQGFIHGAILPTHVLINPISHGARIIDWSYAVERKGTSHVRALSRPYRAFYAPERPDRKPPTPATDIYMASKVFLALLGGNVETGETPDTVPEPIRRFLRGCLMINQASRPDNAWDLHDELTQLLEKVVGKPKYRHLDMPPRAKA